MVCSFYYEGVMKKTNKQLTEQSIELTSANECLQKESNGHKQVKMALQESEVKYKSIVENYSDVIMLTQPDGTISYMSPACHAVLGWEPETLINRQPLIHHPDDIEKAKELFANALNGKKGSLETRIITEAGEQKQIFHSWSPLFSKGRLEMIVSVVRDITARKKAEHALLLREKYLAALSQAKEILLTSGSDNKLQQFVDILGPASQASRTYIFTNHTNAQDEVLMSQQAEYCADGVKPEIDNPALQNLKYDEFFPRWHKALSKGALIAGRIKKFPGTEIEILEPQGIKAILIIPLTVEKTFSGFIGFDNCVSEREWDSAERDFLQAAAGSLSEFMQQNRMQERLKAEYNRFKTAMDAIDASVYAADMQTHELLFVNKKMKDELGAETGRKCYAAIQQGQTGPCAFCTNHLLLDKNGRPKAPYVWEFQNTITKRWYQLRDQAVHWADGRLVRLEIANDITELKQSEQVLKQSLKTKTVLLQEVNHRVKNNLVAINGMLLIERNFAEKATRPRTTASVLNDLANRIKGLSTVHDMLSASEWAPMPLHRLARKVTEAALKALPSDKYVKLKISYDTAVMLISRQAHHITIVINELAVNVIKYAASANEKTQVAVHIAHKSDKNEVLFEFRDNGPGFSEKALRPEGGNVGMYLIKNTVRHSLHGQIDLYNDNGAVIAIRFKHET
jgi:PAS domain S-box-containing protein